MLDSYIGIHVPLFARSHLFRFAASGGEPEKARASEVTGGAEVAVRHRPTEASSVVAGNNLRRKMALSNWKT